MYRGSAFGYVCSCGRRFTQPGALKNHQNACLKCKKRLSAVLAKTKEQAAPVEASSTEFASGGSSAVGADAEAPDAFNTARPSTEDARLAKRRKQFPNPYKSRAVIKMFQDVLPQPPNPLPSTCQSSLSRETQRPDLLGGCTRDESAFPTQNSDNASSPLSPERTILETPPNTFGLFRRYFSGQLPSHDPESEINLLGLSNVPLSPEGQAVNPAFHPYPNESSFRLGEWYWNGGLQKSQAGFKELVKIVGDCNFQPSHVLSTNWDKVNRGLAGGVDDEEWLDQDAGWETLPVTISVPFHRLTPNPGCRDYTVQIRHRPLISVIQEKLRKENDIRHFHYEPYELLWQSPNKPDPIRIYGELYTSPTFIEAHKALQNSPREPGCNLPRIIVALMFWSDGTHLTEFGDAKLWPLYMFFGNESKYRRNKPSFHLCEHVAYFETARLPASFKDFVTTYTGNKGFKTDLLAHCHRELTHAQLASLFDDHFLVAYRHGFVMACCDGNLRRFYPRVFTHSADYKEKTLMALIRHMGTCPCPRCMIPLSKTHLLGMKSDRKARVAQARVDDGYRRDLISAARKAIYEQHFDVSSAAVERILKPKSLVPTSNAFSDRLSAYGLDFHTLFPVDLMHEVELGVWKALFLHLLRILQAADQNLLHELDRRFRMVPTFGRDTIRRFSSNVSELKRLTARDFEDLLQCAIPVCENLLPEPHNKKVLRLLFTFGHWHGLAKLRMHTEETLGILDDETSIIGHQLRSFESSTCSAYRTSELPREVRARERRQHKDARSSAKRPPSLQERRTKEFNLHTYKMHALGDYVSTIKQYGTTDSYNTAIVRFLNLDEFTDSQTAMLQGELEHRVSKSRYKRTSKKGYISQLTQIERRQARIRAIRQKVSGTETGLGENESVVKDLHLHHHIGVSEKNSEQFGTFLRLGSGDPAIKDFWPKLKHHILARFQAQQAKIDGLSSPHLSIFPLELDQLFFKKDSMYRHNTMRINYTTYDVRRDQDVINPNTNHCDVMLLSNAEGTTKYHEYAYARVLGIYHVNAFYLGRGISDNQPRRVEFLWVRWFRIVDDQRARDNWALRRLDAVQFLPVTHEQAFGFVDPADVLRGCHIIPRFAKGMRHAEGRGISRYARDSKDWSQYVVGRFVDRDMIMRYHWGLAVGHIYARLCPDQLSRCLNSPSPSTNMGFQNGSDPASDEEYEVESILASRLHRGKLQYQVHWKGYPSEEDSWEPEEHLTNSPDLIRQFHRDNPLSPCYPHDLNNPTNLEDAEHMLSENEDERHSNASFNSHQSSGEEFGHDDCDSNEDLAFDEMYGDTQDVEVLD